MSSHFPDHAFLTSNNVAIMQHGSFMAYGPAEEVVTEENLKQTYGVDVSITYSHDVERHVCVPHKAGQCRCRDPQYPVCMSSTARIASNSR
jgi:iron complex transport system ATP-binding protein